MHVLQMLHAQYFQGEHGCSLVFERFVIASALFNTPCMMQAVVNGARFSVRQMSKQQDNAMILVKDPAAVPSDVAVVLPVRHALSLHSPCCNHHSINICHEGVS